MEASAQQPLGKWGRISIGAFFVFLLLFGCVVEKRSAFMQRRMGDLDVFLRAAWAVRADADLYRVTSDNDWHYIYPPLYAILLTPLADPPPGHDAAGFLPYAVSVAICYILSILSLLWGVHVLATALEERADDPSFRSQPRFCRRWWALRIVPILICWLPIGHTLMRGQVNLIVVGLLCIALAGLIRGRNFRAGIWLSLAICIKVIPAYLLVYPFWKRDGRGLLGCGLGLFAGLVIIPTMVFGPDQTQAHYATYGHLFFAPFLKLHDEKSPLDEEIVGGVNATESIGVRNALHNWIFPDPAQRPSDLPAWGKAVYVVLGLIVTALTLWPCRGGSTRIPGRYSGHPFAALILLMALFSPVCHSHYLTFCLPVVMCLLSAGWQFQPTVAMPRGLAITFLVFFLTMAVAYMPGMEILKDRCVSLFAALPLWLIPVVQLWRHNATDAGSTGLQTPARKAA